MKIAARIAQAAFVMCLPVFLVTASVGAAFNCRWLYSYGFGKYDIAGVTGIERAELDKSAGALISYWNSGEEYISIIVEKNGAPFALFNAREIAHLKDVKALVRLDYAALAVTGLICAGYAAFAFWYRRPSHRRDLATAGFSGGIVSLGLLAVVGALALADPGGVWEQFHLMSFTNDLWLLDPRQDYLIMMFPEDFWADSVLVVGGLTAFLAVFIGLSSRLYLRKCSGQ